MGSAGPISTLAQVEDRRTMAGRRAEDDKEELLNTNWLRLILLNKKKPLGTA